MDDSTGRVGAIDPTLPAKTDARARELRAEIAETRDEMSETIEAIQDRLTPSNIVANATDSVRSAATEKVKQMANTAGDAADRMMNNTFMDSVRANPLPAAMIGIGAAWLLMKGRPREDDDRKGASRASETVDEVRYAARRTARRAQFSFDRVLRENPLALGAAATLVGAAIGMTMPATETENELMGEARDSVVGRAREMASDAAERVSNVAEELKSPGTSGRL